MQTESPLSLSHSHNFSNHNHQGEKRTYYVLLLTLITMTVEIAAGMAFGSMALLADGWHMGTHAAAFCITLFAYRYSKKHADSAQFSFGTGKVSVLGGYTSAIALGLVALLMVVESVSRLFSPQTIQFNEAIGVAVVGLIVNVASMLLLHGHHDHDHHHDHSHNHSQHKHDHGHHHDHNLKAAYMHVLADALTSLLAIVALIVGKYLGWTWLDPIMGIVGALVITKWAIGLMSQTSPILLDASIEQDYKDRVVHSLQQTGAKVADIHIWKVSADHYSAAISLITDNEAQVNFYRQELKKFDKISHLTIEVNREI